jgi:hypothetical protein
MPCTSSSSIASAWLVDLRERQLLAQPVALPFVAHRVEALREQECLVQAIELLLDDFDALLLPHRPVLRFGASLLPDGRFLTPRLTTFGIAPTLTL